jgi:ActR/RegA family two-component response regulator
VLILDMHLASGEGGLHAVRTLRHELDAETPALIITGDLLEHYRTADEPKVQWLRKPVNVDALMQSLAAATQSE